MPQRVYGDEQLQSAVHYLQRGKEKITESLILLFLSLSLPFSPSLVQRRGNAGNEVCLEAIACVLVWIHISVSPAFHLPLQTTCLSLSLGVIASL